MRDLLKESDTLLALLLIGNGSALRALQLQKHAHKLQKQQFAGIYIYFYFWYNQTK